MINSDPSAGSYTPDRVIVYNGRDLEIPVT